MLLHLKIILYICNKIAFMKKEQFIIKALILGIVLSACNKRVSPVDPPKAIDSEFVRLLVADVASADLHFVNMHTLQTNKH